MMQHTMRWYGPDDPVDLWDIRQSGCTGVVSALHQIPVGEIWTVEEINKRKTLIEAAGMTWTVIESLPVHEDIKRQYGHFQEWIEKYKISLQNVAACGLKVVTYNFMPILDWVRTDISFEMPDRSRALYFEKAAFIAFDMFLLKRPGAEKDYTPDEIERGKKKLAAMSQEEKDLVCKNTLLGLPGSREQFTPEKIFDALKKYEGIDRAKLKEHLFYFLQEVVPIAEGLGLKMAYIRTILLFLF